MSQIAVHKDVLQVPPGPGQTVTVTSLAGDTLYYADFAQVSAASNLGSLSSGQSTAAFSEPIWVVSASETDVTLTYASQSSGSGESGLRQPTIRKEACGADGADPLGSHVVIPHPDDLGVQPGARAAQRAKQLRAAALSRTHPLLGSRPPVALAGRTKVLLIALACVTLVALATLAFARSEQRAHQDAQAQWATERRELLTRIQHPKVLPHVAPAEPFKVPEREVDEWARVGQIEISDDYGLSDDGE